MHKTLLYTTILILNLFLFLSSYLIIDVAFKQFDFKLDWGVISTLLGGAISGGLTLLGVKYTIKHEKDTRDKDQIPSKIELIRKSQSELKVVINNTSLMPSTVFDNFNRSKDILFEYASKIDIDCYNELLKIGDNIDHINEIGIDMDRENVDFVGRPTISQKGLKTIVGFKNSLIDYQELLNNKMVYYQRELSR